MVDTSVSEVNLSTVSERKVETIENSEPTFDEGSITGNRIIDMELFAAVIHMLGCPPGKNTSIILQEDYEKKKGLASLLTANCTSCDFCTGFYQHDLTPRIYVLHKITIALKFMSYINQKLRPSYQTTLNLCLT